MAPEGVRKLHVSALFFDAGRHLASLLFWAATALVFAARTDEAWYLIFLLPPFVGALARYVSFRYTLTEDHLLIRAGILVRSVRHVPYARIQNIDTLQGPLHRLLDVVEVRLETAGGDEPEAVFRVVSSAQLAELRARVLGSRAFGPAFDPRAPAIEAAVGAASPEPRVGEPGAERVRESGGQPFFRMRPADILVFGLCSQKGLLYLGGLMVAVREFEPWEELGRRFGADPATWITRSQSIGAWGWLGFALFLLLLLQFVTVSWAFLTLAHFRIERRGEDLRTTCGFFTRQTASLPRGRIQFLQVRQGLLQRWLGRISLKALSAGGDSTRESQIARKWIVPLAPRAELARILTEVQPEADLDTVAWCPVHPRAVRRVFLRRMMVLLPLAVLVALHSLWQGLLAGALAAALAWCTARLATRALGWGVGERAIFLRAGVLTRRISCVRFEKIQSVTLAQTPFDRRARMATLAVDTAGVGASELCIAIPYLGLREARSLASRLERETAAAAFQW